MQPAGEHKTLFLTIITFTTRHWLPLNVVLTQLTLEMCC